MAIDRLNIGRMSSMVAVSVAIDSFKVGAEASAAHPAPEADCASDQDLRDRELRLRLQLLSKPIMKADYIMGLKPVGEICP